MDRPLRKTEATLPSSGTAPKEDSPAVAAARIAHRLHDAIDWHGEIAELLELLGRSCSGHRAILFRLEDMAGQGLTQSVAAYWVDSSIAEIAAPPSIIPQAVVHMDPLLGRIAREGRQGKMFAGLTRDIEGFLRQDFENQRIVSFLSVPVWANGTAWGSLAVNDCVEERVWTDEIKAAMEIVALAIGDAIERLQSDQHVSEVVRRTMIQASLDAIIVIDETGAVIEFNPAAEKMFGYRRSDILGRDLLHMIVPHYYRRGYSTGAEYMAGRGAPMIGQRLETVTQNAAGEIFPIELTATEIKVADRRLIFGSIRDLREKLRAEEEIHRQRERLHQNEKMAAMGSLLAGVSHELNNPLAVVVAQSTLLHEFAADAPTKIRAEKVRAAAERCGRIVKSFLSMVRLHPSSQIETDLNQVVRAALELTAYGARSNGILIDSDFATGPLLAMADADHITQVAANFLINSQHALAGVQHERRIIVRTFRADNGNPRFSVEDNGPGVPEPIRHRIFESYFTTKPVGVGTGIGLSISKAIVERHEGQVWFESVEPQGARFVVELPGIASATAAVVDGRAKSSGLRHALIIDDEPDVAASLSDILELMGIKSRIARGWLSLAQTLSDLQPDIVFSDLRMPGTGGMEIYRRLQAERPALARRFVVVTGDLVGAKAEIEALPVADRPLILEKPFSTLDVRGVLAAIAETTG